MPTSSPDHLWLGRRCEECGQRLTGRQKKYCSSGCRELGKAAYKRDYDQKNREAARARRRKQKKNATPADGKKRGTALRAAAGMNGPGCAAAGQPPVSDVGVSSSPPPPFPGNKARAGGTDNNDDGRLMFCGQYGQVIPAAVCRRRRQRLESSGNYIDVLCALSCRGERLRPATREEVNRHRARVRQVAREKGVEVSKCAIV